ncbi:ABC transporter permease [Neobacillus sp. SM06]|uniref:ABC transporter permease n=1 Tax=Neobacillus sp. SM06 TaxID=3422492 RepID=UPI003D2E269F
MRWRNIKAVLKKEIRELIRDPYSIGTALILPVVMLLLFGFALNFEVKNVPIGVLDQDQTSFSREYIQAFDHSDTFDVAQYVTNAKQLDRLMKEGKIKAGIIIPPDFTDNLYRARLGTMTSGRKAKVQTLIDGSFSPIASETINYINAIHNTQVESLLKKANIPVDSILPIQIEPRIWYNPSMKSESFIIPGLFAVLLMVFPPLLSVLAVVREKEKGSIQQIYIAPIRSIEYLLGKLLPYGILGFGVLLLIFIGGKVFFSIDYRGNFLLFLLAGTIYVFTTVGIGLLISTLMEKQLSAMFLTIVVTMMPAMLFSGFLYPISTMPKLFQGYSTLFPARFFVDISRDILVKGLGLRYVWENLLLLIGYTITIIAAAVWRFKKRVG